MERPLILEIESSPNLEVKIRWTRTRHPLRKIGPREPPPLEHRRDPAQQDAVNEVRGNGSLPGARVHLHHENSMVGDERVEKLWFFAVQKIVDKISKTQDLENYLWFISFKSKPDIEKLKDIVNTKKISKINKGEILLAQLSSHVFWHAIHEIKEGKDVQDIFMHTWFEVLYKFYEKEMLDYQEKYTELLNPEWLDISDGFKKDVSLLIKGYEYYIQHKDGEKSERQLCEHIEAVEINRVLNVRQYFHQYDRFFEEMGSAVDTTIDNEFKITYLKLCADPYLPA